MRGARRKWSLWVLPAFSVLATYGIYKISEADCFVLTGDVVCRIDTTQPVVALSFDDGPTPAGAEQVASVLDRYGVKATFFLVGSAMEAHPAAVRRLREAGHELANHSYTHRRMVMRPARFYDTEIARTDALFRQAGGPAPRFFRPPYGKKLVGLPLAVERAGYRMIMWDVAEPRGAGDDHRAIAAHIVREARPGSIVIMHVMHRANAPAQRALPLVIEGLRARGFAIVTVGRLLALERHPPVCASLSEPLHDRNDDPLDEEA